MSPCAHKPPPALRYLQLLARVTGGGGMGLLAQAVRFPVVRDLPIAYGWLSAQSAEVEDGWVTPVRTDPGVRRDLGKVLRGIARRYTMDAAARLRTVDRPVLLAWGSEDLFFGVAFAERLARDLPQARLHLVPGSRTFLPLDAPDRLADLIVEFALAGT